MSWLKALLKEKNATQTALAAHLGVQPPRVSEMIRGARKVQIRELPLLAEFFGKPVNLIAALASGQLDDFGPLPAKEIEATVIRLQQPPEESPDTFVPPVDQWQRRIQTEDSARDVPVLGIQPRRGVGDFEMGEETGAFVRRPAALRGRSDVRAVYTQSGDLLFLETTRPPRSGDRVLVVLHKEGGMSPAYLRTLGGRTGSKLSLEKSGSSPAVDIDIRKVAAMYRVLNLADLFG